MNDQALYPTSITKIETGGTLGRPDRTQPLAEPTGSEVIRGEEMTGSHTPTTTPTSDQTPLALVRKQINQLSPTATATTTTFKDAFKIV